MRIVFLHHFPLSHDQAGQWLQQAASGLVAAGHEVRVLLLGSSAAASASALPVETIVCRADGSEADLRFGLPAFSNGARGDGGPLFQNLSDLQLGEYRDRVRRRLDAIIDQFDPHVVHAQYVWIGGQLALESGVPYCLNAWGPELADYAADPRYHDLADQAAENAGRILSPSTDIAVQVEALFPLAADRLLVMPELLTPGEASTYLTGVYQAILADRFGKPF